MQNPVKERIAKLRTKLHKLVRGTDCILYTFTGGTDGGNQSTSLLRDPADNLYGTTLYGGNLSCPSNSTPTGRARVWSGIQARPGWERRPCCTPSAGAMDRAPLVWLLAVEVSMASRLPGSGQFDFHRASRNNPWHDGVMADTVPAEQIRGESNELREAALKLREQAASLIEKAMELEEQIARLQRNLQEPSKAAKAKGSLIVACLRQLTNVFV